MVTTAASISHKVLLSEASNAIAAPWNWVRMSDGIFNSASTWFTKSTASPNDTPSAKSNEMVLAGNCPRWFTAKWVRRSSTVAMLDSGTGVPEAVGT